MTPRAAQAKGKRLEKFLCDMVEEAGLGKAVRTPGSGSGNIKGDIFSNVDFMFECKNQKQFHWHDIDQAKEEARSGNYDRDKWSLILRDPRHPEFEEVYAVIDLGQFLTLLKRSKEPVIKEADKEASWAIRNLIQAAKKVLKRLEKQ